MGCHTWTYKKFKSCNKKTRDEFIAKCNDEVSSVCNTSLEQYRKVETDVCDTYIKHAKKQNDEVSVKEWEEYKNNTDERYYNELKEYEPFKDGITEDNVLQYCKNHYNSADMHIENDTLYLQIGFDTPFRLYGYPEDSFTNKDELLKFLSENSDNIGYYYEDNWMNGYSEILVRKINDYFKKHGEDNLYFEFG